MNVKVMDLNKDMLEVGKVRADRLGLSEPSKYYELGSSEMGDRKC